MTARLATVLALGLAAGTAEALTHAAPFDGLAGVAEAMTPGLERAIGADLFAAAPAARAEAPAAVPLPTGAALLLGGLMGLVLVRRRR